jgi:hypothetical protein
VSRSTKACINCGETREVAAHGLCFKCYRQEERKLSDDLWAKPDQHAKDLAKVQRKTRKALMKMMDALEEIDTGRLVPQETVEQWRSLLCPEVARIALCLTKPQIELDDKQDGESSIDPDDDDEEKDED